MVAPDANRHASSKPTDSVPPRGDPFVVAPTPPSRSRLSPPQPAPSRPADARRWPSRPADAYHSADARRSPRAPSGRLRLGRRAAALAGGLLARPRLALALAGLLGLLAAGLLLAATLGRGAAGRGVDVARPADAPPAVGAGATKPGEPLPGIGWATFTRRACEWSNVTTPPAICFGERQPGFRVRVLEPSGRRWHVWDPETRNVAYVDPDALRRE